jgi:hypothetical protein
MPSTKSDHTSQTDQTMETFLSILVGLGLSAACGFRVFVPLLIASLAARTGHLQLAAGFQWMSSDLALIAFGVATALEIGGYYIPWLDHALDTLATPAAVVAGTLVSASVITDLDPFLRWTLALIAGGGIAGLVQGGTVVARAASTATTGGLANPLVATTELTGSVTASLTAVVVPLLGLALLAMAVFLWIRWWLARRAATRQVPLNTAAA